MKLLAVISFVLAAGFALAADDAAIITALTGARKVTVTGDGFLLVSHNGTWTRVVRTMDGGYSFFSTNGSSRMFRTPAGFGFSGPSNAYSSVTFTPRGFTIAGASGTVSMVKAGSAWLDMNSTNNFRVIVSADGFSTYSGPLAPTPADTVYELYQQRQSALKDAPAFEQPVPDRYQPRNVPGGSRTPGGEK